MNNKGFSMVELLAVMAILSILSGIAIGAATRYQEKAKQQGYDTLVESAKLAAENYLMDHPSTKSVNFDTLVNEGYLENAIDPGTKSSNCTGTVRIAKGAKGTASKLSQNDYIVYICCTNYTYEIGAGKPKHTDECMADFNEEKYIEPTETQPTNCSSGNIKSKEFNIYTMDYLGKVCNKGSNGIYGTTSTCYDKTNPYGNTNYPCRYYEYYQHKCHCNYSAKTNKYCSSSLVGNYSHHTMRIKYNEDSAGHASCNSDNQADFNSNVHDVCWEGRYKSGQQVMTFHGYQFFKGQSTGYVAFDPNGSWFHDKIGDGNYDIRVTRGNNVDNLPSFSQGCRDTCVRFTETLSGKVD